MTNAGVDIKAPPLAVIEMKRLFSVNDVVRIKLSGDTDRVKMVEARVIGVYPFVVEVEYNKSGIIFTRSFNIGDVAMGRIKKM